MIAALILLLFLSLGVISALNLLDIVASKQFQLFSSSESSPQKATFDSFTSNCIQLQAMMIHDLQLQEGVDFKQDKWTRYLGGKEAGELMGFGNTAVVTSGKFIEKGAVSTSFLRGKLSKDRAMTITARNPQVTGIREGQRYSAAALSLVLHTLSPHIPTFRADIRCFQVFSDEEKDNEKKGSSSIWFGGGVDLTPYYLYEEDVKEFHQTYRLLCNRYDPSLTHSSTTNDHYGALYEKLKAQCDDYFYIPHRREHRGVGGLFFDDLHSFPSYLSPVTPSEPSNKDDEMLKVQEFMLDFGKELMPSFQRICSRRQHLPYTERQKQWQQIRRGRYVEFNLVYDRGVKFGLVPGGRIEAVLVSCPPVVQWSELEHLSAEEEKVVEVLKNPRRW